MGVRKAAGQTLIEVTALIVVAMPVLLLVLDGGVYLSAMYINDCACREAVRAISQRHFFAEHLATYLCIHLVDGICCELQSKS